MNTIWDEIFEILPVLLVLMIAVVVLIALLALPFVLVQQSAIEEITGVKVPLKHVMFLTSSQMMQLYDLTEYNIDILE